MVEPGSEADASPAAGGNQRRYPRRTARLPALLSFPWGDLSGTIENIGEGGVFFVTENLEGAVQVGDHATLRFASAEREDRAQESDVLRVEQYFHEGDLYRAFALRFGKPRGPTAGHTPV